MVKPHGLRGDVVVELYGDRPERTRPGAAFETSRGVLRVQEARPFAATGAGRFIVRFEGVDDRDEAERWRDVALLAPPLADGEALWVHELVGATVVDPDGKVLGEVAAVVANPASDLLELAGGGLIPLTFVVGHAPGRVVVDIPDGLLE